MTQQQTTLNVPSAEQSSVHPLTPEAQRELGGPVGTQPDRGHSTLRHLSLRARVSIAAAVLTALVVTIFAAQNTHGSSVNFLGWSSSSAPLFVVILASTALGIIIGWSFTAVRWRRRLLTAPRR
jgi:uncharacterized integral membrane protein